MLGLEEKAFDQPVKNHLKTYDSIQIISTGQGDDSTMGILLDYVYCKNYYKIITIDLSKTKHPMLIQKQCNKLILQEI